MAEPGDHRHSYDEYVAFDAASQEKHEYCQGVILAMAGGTPEHSLLKSNLGRHVGNALDGRPCRAFDADLRTLVEVADFATYPDLSVVCGPFQRSPRDPNALTNPTVLFEVLSRSTAAYDLGEKFDRYALLPTLQEYVVVDTERVSVRVFRRDGVSWVLDRYGPGDTVELRSVDARFAVDAVYDGWAELRATAP